MADDAVRRARAWVDHLRRGGTTPWRTVLEQPPVDAAPGGSGRLPGAAQLESARRLNVLGGEDTAAHRRLVDRLLETGSPGRGQPDLDLVGVPQTRFGPPPVDPADLPEAELLRVVVGALAEVVVHSPAAEVEASRPRVPRRPWQRGFHLVGNPVLADATHAALASRGVHPGRRAPLALVLADDLGAMLADLWSWRVEHTGAQPSWRWWMAHWARVDELPPRLDLAQVARRWGERVGPERVHVVIGADPLPAVGALLGGRATTATGAGDRDAATYDGLSPEAAELVRLLNGVLLVMVEPERHRQLLARVVQPLVADRRGARRLVVPRQRAWVLDRAERLREELRSGGYAVHGDPTGLLPRDTGRDPEPTDDGVLEVGLRTLLRTKEAGG